MPRASLAVADRRTQRAAVVGALHEAPLSRSALVERFGVSSPLITRVVRSLIDDGVIHELGPHPQTVGRPAMRLEVNRHYGTIIAASCTADAMHLRSSDLHDIDLDERRTPLRAGPVEPERFVDEIVALARRTPRALAIGVSVPGVVDVESGNVSAAPDLGWDAPVPLRDLLHERTGLPVTIDNDVNLMMMAEHRSLHGTAHENAAYLFLGARGIGAGIIASGTLMRGAHGAAGEIGLVPLPAPGTEIDLEDAVSITAIAQRLERAGHRIDGDPIATLLELADAGRPEAVSARADLIAVLGYAITLLSAIVNPSLVLLGGGAQRLREQERAAIAQAVSSRLPFHPALEFARALPDSVLDSARHRAWAHALTGGL